MPKLTVTLSELKRDLAEKYNINEENVHIDVQGTIIPINERQLDTELRIIIHNSAHKNAQGMFRDKITLIKAVRTITGMDLKTCKELVEESLAPE